MEFLTLERKVTCKPNSEDSYNLESAIYQVSPDQEWLQLEKISTDSIKEWWNKKDELRIGDIDFSERLGTKKPSVKLWKKHSINFINDNFDLFKTNIQRVPVDHKKVTDLLPPVIPIPAIRELSDETKILKSNPFGILIKNMKENITDDEYDKVSTAISGIEKYISPSGVERFESFTNLEEKISQKLKRLIDGKILLLTPVPDFQSLLDKIQINIDDGIDTSAEK